MGRRIRRRLATDEGLTLVELLAALVVIGIVLAATASTLITSLMSVATGELRVRASQIANEEIENLRSIPWSDAGFLQDDLDAAVDTAGVAYGSGFEGDDYVVLDEDVAGDLVPLPGARPAWDDRYTVETHIVEVDDGLIDTEGHRRFVVLVSWSDRGTDRVLRAEALRTPTSDEVDFEELEILFFEISQYDVIPQSQQLTPSGNTSQDIAISVRTTLPASSVVLSYVQKDGSPVTLTLADASGDGLHWTANIGTTGEFDAGSSVPFEVTAHSAVDGSSDEASTNVHFLTPELPSIEILSPDVSPALCVSNSGNPRVQHRASEVTVRIRHVTSADDVSMTWETSSGETAVSGPSFDGYEDGGETAVFRGSLPSGTTYSPPANSTVVRIDAHREADMVEAGQSYTRTLHGRSDAEDCP